MKEPLKLARVLALLLCMALALTAAGCGGGGGKSETPTGSKGEEKTYDLGGRTIHIASWGDATPQETDPHYAEKMSKIEEIEKKYNCKLDFSAVAGAEDYMTYMQTTLSLAMSGEKIADAFVMDTDRALSMFAANDLIVPIDDYIDFATLEKEGFTKENEAWVKDGKHYFITDWLDEPGHMILFNKKIVSDNNISPESLYKLQKDGDWTWDKLSEYAIKCTKDTNNDGVNDTWGFGAYSGSPYTAEPFIYSNGTSPVKISDDYKYTYNLEDPACMAAIEFGHKLCYDDKVCDLSVKDWGYWEALWLRGRVAFYEAPRWEWQQCYDAFSEAGLEYGILFVPKGPNAKDYVASNSIYAGYCMQPMVEDKEAVGAVLTDWMRFSRSLTNLEDKYQSLVFDDESMETIKMCEGRVVSIKGGVVEEFRNKVLWSDWGILSNTPAQTFVAQWKAPSQALMDQMNSGKIPEVSSEG